MADDLIREAFDLLEHERPLPSSGFADALFDRLVAERNVVPQRRVIPRVRKPSVSPRLRTALLAAAALAVVAAVLLPLLPLTGNRELRETFPAGEVVWVRQFGTEGFDLSLGGVAVTGSYVHVSSTAYERSTYGSFRSTVDTYETDGDRLTGRSFRLDLPAGTVAADPSGGIYVVERSMAAGYPDELIKVSAGGRHLWKENRSVSLENLTDNTQIYGLAADEHGVYVAGGTSGSVHAQDGFVASFDPDGQLLWATRLSTSWFDRALGVAADATGIYVVGASGGKNTGPGTLWKVDRNGEIAWTRRIATGANFISQVAVDDGTIYVGGQEGTDALLASFSEDGTRRWTKHWSTKGQDWVTGIVPAGARVYVAATTGLRFDEVGQGSRVSKGWGIVRAFDVSGTALWGLSITNDGVVQVESLAMGSGALYVGGITDGVFSGQHNADGDDAFVLKLGVGKPTGDAGSG
jgi:hypothetical protein